VYGLIQPQLTPVLGIALAVLVVSQAVILWVVFNTFWSRLALATTFLLLGEALVVKWFQPHYFAPAASLVVFLQTEALRRLWHATSAVHRTVGATQAAAGARRQASGEDQVRHSWRSFVVAIPVACVVLLGLQITGRVTSRWRDLPRRGAATFLLPESGWSLRRAALVRWLQSQASPQLVFVQYASNHDVIFEWVYNHAGLMKAHVVWARDLGVERNRELVAMLPDRQVWSLDADYPIARLIPYGREGRPVFVAARPITIRDGLPW
jgi:hypothetical protein